MILHQPFSLRKLERKIEAIAREAILSHYPLDWKEDSITHQIVREFRKAFSDITLHSESQTFQLAWEAYKLSGNREMKHGDIGLLFRRNIKSGKLIEGAGFLEAKIRSRDSSNFPHAGAEQSSRITQNSPFTQLALYDYRPAAISEEGGPFFDDLCHVTHVPVIPLPLANAIDCYDDGMYDHSTPLSHQFTRRYFQLRDLDFSASAINAVKGYPSELGGTNVVMVVRMSPIGQPLPEAVRPNPDLYSPLQE